ncbi:hypothetical protein [Agrobacterium tumefaciens]|uniref:hypothetical protein n=1 Tax=Agrobacterium tumefaciens TaxID=358 RepID=UPI0009B95B57|nr:hypothetical protein [Agrobacterium tumefaciens]
MPIFVVSLVVGAYFVDTGLLASLREGSLNSLRRDKIRRGAALESRDVSSELFFGIGAPIPGLGIPCIVGRTETDFTF